jgi:hypothetical protein
VIEMGFRAYGNNGCTNVYKAPFADLVSDFCNKVAMIRRVDRKALGQTFKGVPVHVASDNRANLSGARKGRSLRFPQHRKWVANFSQSC